MRALSAEDLLNVWDVGQRQCHWDRALSLLSAADRDQPRSVLADLSLGERDRLLLQLRQIVFGPELEGLVDCPSCGDHLQFILRTADLLAPAGQPVGLLESNGYRIEFRPTVGADLESLPADVDVAEARMFLIDRCVLRVVYKDAQVSTADLPPEVIQKLAGAMDEVDPQGNVELALVCAGCGHHWQQLFDIASFFWAEVHAWAMRAFYEVDQLALNYGWHEAEIIRMNTSRRQIYLGMLGT